MYIYIYIYKYQCCKRMSVSISQFPAQNLHPWRSSRTRTGFCLLRGFLKMTPLIPGYSQDTPMDCLETQPWAIHPVWRQLQLGDKICGVDSSGIGLASGWPWWGELSGPLPVFDWLLWLPSKKVQNKTLAFDAGSNLGRRGSWNLRTAWALWSWGHILRYSLAVHVEIHCLIHPSTHDRWRHVALMGGRPEVHCISCLEFFCTGEIVWHTVQGSHDEEECAYDGEAQKHKC